MNKYTAKNKKREKNSIRICKLEQQLGKYLARKMVDEEFRTSINVRKAPVFRQSGVFVYVYRPGCLQCS